jgi:hypothetical protein
LAVDNPNCDIKKAKNFCSFKILGTTFSGHPTRTTLGNTLWTICFANFYGRGLDTRCIAAGDDCVMFCESFNSTTLVNQIRALSSKDSSVPNKIGLG